MEEELDLIEYWQVLKKRWALVITLPVIAALTAGILSFFVYDPVYQASTTLIVGKKAEDGSQQAGQLLDYSVLMANQQLAKTYEAIAKSRTVEENVIKELNLPLTQEELDQKVTISLITNTEVLEIAVQDTDPALAAEIANSTARQFSEAVIEIKKVDSVSIVDRAVAPQDPIKPNKTMNVLIAFMVGLMASVGLAFVLEFLDNTIKTHKDVEKVLGLPVLGVIPDYRIDDI